MKSTIQNILLAAAGLALGATSAMSADWPPAKGDLVLGVQAISGTGSSTNVFLNLGPAHILRDATEGEVFANLNEELTAAFGSDWATRSDLYFGAVANRSNGPASGLGSDPEFEGDPSRTIYASRGTDVPGGSTAWTGFVSSALGTAATELGGFIDAIDDIAGNANGVMTLSQGANPVQWHNSWSKLNPVPGTAFSIFTGGIQRSFANELGSQPKMLDIYRIQGDNGVGSYVTTIFLTDEGDVLAGEVFFTLTSSADPGEGGSVEGAGTYPENASAELTAIPAEGYGFISWSGDVTSTDNPLTVTVDADMTITANFAQIAIITGPSVTSVTETTATLGGNISSIGEGSFTERGVVYAVESENADPLVGGTGVTKLTTPSGDLGSFTVQATGLAAATTYAVKAFVTTTAGTTYTDVAFFATDTALTLTGGTGSVSGQSILPGEGQSYLFTLTDAREVAISGGTDGLLTELLDANGNVIASGSGVFSFTRALPAGTYRVRVTNQSGSAEFLSFSVDATKAASARPGVTATPAKINSKKAKAVKGKALVRNTGNLPSPITVSASKGNGFFKVVYSAPGGNQTAALNAGRYQTPSLSSASAPVTITAKITPNKKKLLKKKKGKKVRVVKKTYKGSYRASASGAPTAAGNFQVRVR